MTLYAIPIAPADAAPHSRLDADDLRLLQQKALREWRESDWLAVTDPRLYERIRQQDPSLIRVDLGGGLGDASQVPGCIVVGSPGNPEEFAGTLERRQPDFGWVHPNALPFEDATIDELHAVEVPAGLRPVLGREIARVMKVGGRVKTDVNPGETFEREGTTQWWQCIQRTDAMERTGPILIDEKVLGQPIRRERAT